MPSVVWAGMKLCECGCGQPTKIAARTRRNLGHIEGQHLRFVNGHNCRKRTDWIETPGPLKTPCWIWQGTINTEGYGVLRVDYKQWKAHRWVWRQQGGTFPKGLLPDHLCRMRACVNPDHLDWVSSATNTRRGNGISISGYQAMTARLMVLTTTIQQKDIAETLGITKGNMFNILHRGTWSP
jgi:hypothetical protein